MDYLMEESNNNSSFESIPVQFMNTDEVQYVYNDDITDLILEDGTRAMIVNGNLVTAEGHALIIQEDADLNQYTVPEDAGQFTESENEALQVNELQPNPDNEIFYIQEETNFPSISNNSNDSGQLIELADKIIVNENGGVVDLEELLSKQEHAEYEYAILNNGKLYLQNAENLDCKENSMDISNIKKINANSAETKCSNKIENLKRSSKQINDTKKSKFDAEKDKPTMKDLKKLINKKITIGQTDTGKKLIAKITKIIKKHPQKQQATNKQPLATAETEPIVIEDDFEATAAENESTIVETLPTIVENESMMNSQTKSIVHTKTVTKEGFEVISKTLRGLMNMHSVVKKLRNKTLIVKMIEKFFIEETNKYLKKISYCMGFMVREYKLDDTDDGFTENWKFISDDNSKQTISEGNDIESVYQENSAEQGKSKSFANLTIEITTNADASKNTKVIINPPAMFECKVCGLSFRTGAFLKLHSLEQHESNPRLHLLPGLECKKCSIKFKTFSEAEEHSRLNHPKENSLGKYQCVDCNQRFKTPPKIRQHMESHFIPSVCGVCKIRFPDSVSLKKHTMLRHMKKIETKTESEIKKNGKTFYKCDICNRQFSRHSNLLRHIGIHKGDGAMYQCAICNCSYHFISSLTRHVVSCHVDKKPRVSQENSHTELPSDTVTQIEDFEFMQNDQIVQMIPLENLSENALEQILHLPVQSEYFVEEVEG